MAITIHNSAQGTGTTVAGGTAIAGSVRVSAVAESFLVLAVGHRSNTALITSANWQPAGSTTGQVAMTFLGKKVHSSSTLTVEYWGLKAPTVSTTSSTRVVFSHPQAVAFSSWAVCFTGVDQTTPYPGYVTGSEQTTGGGSADGSAATSTITTTMGPITTTAGQVLVQAAAWQIVANTETFTPAASHEWVGSRIASALQTGVQLITATGVSTSSNATLANNTALNSLSWVVAAIPLNPSTTVAPRAVTPTTTAATASSTASPLAVVSTTGFNATNTPSFVYGAFAQQSVSQLNPQRISAVAATTLTYSGLQPANTGIGTRVQELGGFGDNTSTPSTLNFVLPSVALADDIAILTIRTQAASITSVATAAATAWTPITTRASTSTNGTAFLEAMYYKRISAADIVNEASRVSTITPNASAVTQCVVQLYRGCITSGSPVDVSGVAGAAIAANTNVSAASVTTTGVNRLVVSVFANNTFAVNNAAEVATGAWTRRGSYFGLFFGDNPQAASGASSQAVMNISPSGATDWTAITIALIPASGSTTYSPTFLNTLPAMWAAARAALSRQMNFDPTLTVTAQWTSGNAAVATTETYNPTLTVVAQWAGARAVLTTEVQYHRTFSGGPFWAVSRASLTRQVTFDPTISPVQQWAVGRSSVVGAKQGVTTYNPTFLNTLPAFWAVGRAILTRQMNFNRTLTVTFQWAGSRAALTRQVSFHSTLTVAAAWASARAVLTHTENLHPTLTVAAAWASGRATVVGIKQSATAGIPFGTLPLLWLYTAANYVNCGIYFEAQLKSGDTNAVAGQLSDVTGVANPAASGVGTLVVVSQVSTSAPHTTLQRVRSADITSALTDGHVYRAEMNKLASAVPMTMSTAFIDPVELT